MAKSTKITKSTLTAPLFNLQAEKVEDLALNQSIFGQEINDNLIALAVRSHLANQRSAHALVKERGDVAGTTKKMYAQKGTGRARHSTAKVGIFVGGGSVHGPRGNQNFTLSTNKKFRKNALISLLSKFAATNSVAIIDGLSSLPAKTKSAWELIDKMEKALPTLATSKKIGIIVPVGSTSVVRAFRNIPGLTVLSQDSLNVYDLSLQNQLVFSVESINSLK